MKFGMFICWSFSTFYGKGGRTGGGSNPEVKKAQLKELLTKYGPIEFWWIDHATGTGGRSHEETVKWVHKFQPNSFVGHARYPPRRRERARLVVRPRRCDGLLPTGL